MGDNTGIGWTWQPGYTGATWNPIAAFRKMPDGLEKRGWMCVKRSEACANCYAESQNKTGWALGNGLPYSVTSLPQVDLRLVLIDLPLRQRRPRCYFVCSMTDLFGEFVPDWMIEEIFEVMLMAKWHRFLLLTKRPERMLPWLLAHYPNLAEIAPHIWVGVTAEDQKNADERIPLLLKTPAAKRFLSCEPLLGPVDLDRIVDVVEVGHMSLTEFRAARDAQRKCTHIDWVIGGAESGKRARPTHLLDARLLRDRSVTASIPFYWKQWGEWLPGPIVEDRSFCGGLYVDTTCGKTSIDGARRLDARYAAVRVGKKHSGDLLDGRQWHEFPAQ